MMLGWLNCISVFDFFLFDIFIFSIIIQGAEEGIKIPHPPTAPPALKLKDNEADIHPGLEHRSVTCLISIQLCVKTK